VAVGALVGAAALGGCTGHKSAAPPPNGAPTDAALTAVENVHIVVGGTDCGGGPLDAGYPTTMVATPSVCLRDSDRAGEAAYMRFTGRTGTGGAYQVVYTVDGRGGLKINAVLGARSGALHREEWECAVPAEPLRPGVLLGYRGRVVPSLVVDNDRCHRIAD
jgi:hypothetical protein